MPYYAAGDYYGRGDYYRGDPGLLGSLAKGVLGVVKGAIGITPVGRIAIAARTALARRPSPPMITPFAGGGGGVPDYGFPGPGSVPPVGQVMVGGGMAGIPARPFIDVIPRGRHLNKSTYVTRGGGTSKWPMQILVHPAGTEAVRSRRLNVANVRALRRAIRRATGFAKLSRRVLSFVQAKAPKGKPVFKRKR